MRTIATTRLGRAAVLAALSCVVPPSAALGANFPAPELLGRPTDRSVTVSVVADAALEAYFEYGTAPGAYSSATPPALYAAGAPIVVELGGLRPDTTYWYRLRHRAPGAASFDARPEASFRTQRPPHGAFTFTVQADSHIYDKKGYLDLYAVAEQNQAADRPDFMLDLGDTFGDDHDPSSATAASEDQLHLNQRPFMGIVGRSAPVFVVLGNHEGEGGYYLGETPPDNLAVYATTARLKYFPNPAPNDFYSGNETAESGIGTPQDYYAWRWGDALFVVLDAYRFTTTDPKVSGDLWDWTLGKEQYDWFRRTLEGSAARYKFVFAHHVLGQTRGGAAWADKYEWGGRGMNGSYEFDAKRPGWGKPIHQLMVDNHVTIFFQGHDHLYAREELDGVVYQEVPMPSDGTYHVGDVNADAYTGTVLGNSGHLRVTVSTAQVQVDYVRAFRPGEGTNGEVTETYVVQSPAPVAGLSAPATAAAGGAAWFADQSTNGPTSWSWSFGDGATSAAPNPTHVYAEPGVYVATLTVANAFGSDAASATVTVCAPPVFPATIVGARRVLSSAALDFVDADDAPSAVTGYNVYRSSSAAPPLASWTRAATNVVDGGAARPGAQWIDDADGPAPGGALFYRVAAFNNVCAFEGPP